MTKRTFSHRAALGTAMAAVLVASIGGAVPAAPAVAQAAGQTGTYKPSRQVLLSVGEGQLISLPRAVSDVWTSNPGVADVNVTSPRQIGLFGKEGGEATIIATAADGSVVFGANVRVSQNISSVNEVLKAAMPDANITVTHVGQVAVLNGTVQSPADSAQAEMLVRSLLNPGIDPNDPAAVLKIVPINRLKTATPLQVMLTVKIAEVSRSLMRDIGVNLASLDTSGGNTGFIIGRGRTIGSFLPGGEDGQPRFSFQPPPGATGLGLRLNNLFGVNVAGMLDLGETNGLVTLLAEPTLTALSGETASFLAGGEFPIPVASGINGTSIEFKEYGVSLAFTPTVLEGGRISMRVRPEVSELSSEGAIQINGFRVPSLTTRRTETTVELGSGQSFMIGGLMRNSGNNSIERTPGLGSLPILGALFRSNSFRRNESELVIVVTPYLVKPVTAGEIALPTDGFRSANTKQRVLLGKEEQNRTGERRPGPVSVAPATSPGLTGMSPARTPAAPAAARRQEPAIRPAQSSAAAAAPAPGFSF
ncbi:MAG TPA: type II and III secretion system protein family protein [Allosphingosinicella sp.]|nr:type II and III secretion system protein family protein [Allosphingosinicella sp.]